MSQASAPQETVVRLTTEDFTRLGLLTPEEIESQNDIHRAIAIEDADQPLTASIWESEHSWSANGLKNKFSLLAEGGKGPDAITRELTLEASISNVKPTLWKGFWISTPYEGPLQTYFTLVATSRIRNEQDQTFTTEALTAMAVRDPKDPHSFIVDFTSRITPDLPTMMATRGFRAFVEEFQNTAGLKPSDIVDLIKAAQKHVEPRFQQLVGDPGISKTTAALTPKA